MSDLWFDQDLGDVSRRGTMLYVSRPGEVWAVLTQDLVFPDDVGQESEQLLGHYGAAVHGIGQALLGEGCLLPPDLKRWATAADVPAAHLGGWAPGLITIGGVAQLAMRRDFNDVQVHATTWAGQHLTVLCPSALPAAAALVQRSDLTVPPFGWDQHGGVGWDHYGEG